MSEHLSQDDMQNYLDRSLGPEKLVIADDHLAECDVCREKARSSGGRQMADLSQLLADPDLHDGHLSYEQLESYVDGKIGEIEKEIVDFHKGVCRGCLDELDELIKLRATLVLEPAAEQKTRTAEPSSLAAFWNRLMAGGILKFAASVFAALLVGVIIWSVWLFERPLPGDMVAVVDPSGVEADQDLSLENDSAVPDGTEQTSNSDRPLASLVDGGTRVEIDADGNLTGINAPQFESRIKAALTDQDLEISDSARDLKSNSGVLMGDGRPGVSFALTTPVGKIVRSERPQFRWRPLAGAETYVVTVFDAKFSKVAESPPLQQPVWTPAANLKRGSIYQWQVTAIKDGQEIKSPVRPAPDAKFQILSAAAANEIEAAKHRSGNSHLLLGIVYANAGLLDDAEREFQALLNKNPKSDIARKLLNRVRVARSAVN